MAASKLLSEIVSIDLALQTKLLSQLIVGEVALVMGDISAAVALERTKSINR